MGSIVNVVVLYRRHQTLGLLSAVAAIMLSAAFVIVRLAVFGRASPVDLAANKPIRGEMAQSICKVCLKDRRTRNESARRILRTPVETTQHPLFAMKGVPVRLCVHCDGGAYEAAMRGHMDRIDGNEASPDA